MSKLRVLIDPELYEQESNDHIKRYGAELVALTRMIKLLRHHGYSVVLGINYSRCQCAIFVDTSQRKKMGAHLYNIRQLAAPFRVNKEI